MTTLALDIGATKFAVARVSPDGGLHDIRKAPVPATAPWDACRALLQQAAGNETVESIGIASSGPVDMAEGIASPLNIPEWRAGFGLGEAVQGVFPDATVGFALDGVCIALAEQRYGAAKGVMDALVVTLSSGIGGGFLVGGFVSVGRSGNAGHIGHISVPGFDDQCACGAIGCVEAVASGLSSVRWAQSQGWTGNSGIELAASARSGNKTAVQALERAGTALGYAIASAAALLDVGLVVVGGGFAQSGPLLWEPLQAAVTKQARIPFLSELKVVPSPLGDMATLVGAGALVTAPQQATEDQQPR